MKNCTVICQLVTELTKRNRNQRYKNKIGSCLVWTIFKPFLFFLNNLKSNFSVSPFAFLSTGSFQLLLLLNLYLLTRFDLHLLTLILVFSQNLFLLIFFSSCCGLKLSRQFRTGARSAPAKPENLKGDFIRQIMYYIALKGPQFQILHFLKAFVAINGFMPVINYGWDFN